jgi:CheY-like chemotaxis protein
MSRSVLIVDDDPFIRKLISTTLEDVAGFELHEAADGEQALQVANEISPTVIFLDIEMPRMNGVDACRRLREIPECAQARIVMLTAAGHDHERVAREAGANLFLTKPFSPLDLLKLVHDLGA